MIANVFENYWNIFLETYKLDPARFLTLPGIAWQAAFKKTKAKLDLLADIDRLILLEIVIKVRICYVIDGYANANNKYIKNHDKKEPLYLKYWDVNNLFKWTISQRLL